MVSSNSAYPPPPSTFTAPRCGGDGVAAVICWAWSWTYGAQSVYTDRKPVQAEPLPLLPKEVGAPYFSTGATQTLVMLLLPQYYSTFSAQWQLCQGRSLVFLLGLLLLGPQDSGIVWVTHEALVKSAKEWRHLEAHACNSSTSKTEVRGLPWVQGQSGL